MRTRRDFLRDATWAAAAGALPLSGWPLARAAEKKKIPLAPLSKEVAEQRSLRAHATPRGLLVGCAVDPELLAEPAAPPRQEPAVAGKAGQPATAQPAENPYAAVVRDQANILVAENAMKWRALRPTIDRFDFEQADALFNFAAANDQKVRGHNLCWHEALPDWFAGVANKQNARNLLVQHIETVVGRYAGRVHSWDVVNEAIEPEDGRDDALRRTLWLDLIGPEYIDLAYKTAARVDPAAKLTYNDYGIELDTPEETTKRAQVLLMLRRFKDEGVPIHAVGVQSHLTAGTNRTPGEGLRHFVSEAGKLGLEVYITEMDVNDSRLTGSFPERDQAVADVYRQYLKLMLAEPSVSAILTWGITDRSTWLNSQKMRRRDGRPQRPLPFDADFHPKAAFFALRDAIDTRNVPHGGEPGSAAPYGPFNPKPVPKP